MNIRKEILIFKMHVLPATQMDNKIVNLPLCRLDTIIIQRTTGKIGALNHENLNLILF